jgi:hypothetical protein
MRGKCTATPDRWRLDRWIPSNAISNTNSGFTTGTGPNFSTVLPRMNSSACRISSSVSPEYALTNGTS